MSFLAESDFFFFFIRNAYSSSTNLQANIKLVMRSRWALREVRWISIWWRNLSKYIYATTKQEGLQFEYLKILSIYCLILNAGTLDPWKIVITSFWLDAFNPFSFFWMHFSSAEDKIARIRGGPGTPLLSNSSRTPILEQVLDLKDLPFSARAPISK